VTSVGVFTAGDLFGIMLALFLLLCAVCVLWPEKVLLVVLGIILLCAGGWVFVPFLICFWLCDYLLGTDILSLRRKKAEAARQERNARNRARNP